jgi:hypothetical protein
VTDVELRGRGLKLGGYFADTSVQNCHMLGKDVTFMFLTDIGTAYQGRNRPVT